MSFRQLLPVLFCFIWTSTLTAQDLTYDTRILPRVERAAVVNLAGVKEDYAPQLIFLEAPSPDGDSYRAFLEREKKEVERRFPRKPARATDPNEASRSTGQEPLLNRAFPGNLNNVGIPLDTHCGISNDGQVVAVINGDVVVKDSDGNTLHNVSLDAFFTSLDLENTNPFDPKIHYDPDADRWILFALGIRSQTQVSRVFIGFSQTNDAAGDWNLYKLDGNPLVTNTWLDYPMASISEHEVFLTGNSVRWNEPWQTGFDQTMIFQLNKRKGYLGEPLDNRVWANIQLGGLSVRNMCPVKGAAGNYGPNHYFLSNRNFDQQNNTIFILEILDTINAPGANIRLDARTSDVFYGLAPNAQQAGGGTLATNDSRILDAFYWNDRIQFVGNSIDTATGKPSIYHGFIDQVSTSKVVTGHIIGDDSLELGYPSISYMGSSDPSWGEEDALIFFDFTSKDHFASTAAVYYDNFGEYSSILRTRPGTGFIDALFLADERWGDYTGNQRKYNEPGIVWTMGTLGLGDNRQATWIAEFGRPLPAASIDPEKNSFDLNAFPNPVREKLTVEFEIPAGKEVNISLFDASGKRIRTFVDDIPRKDGKASFSFSAAPLSQGIYYLRVRSEDGMLASKKVVVE